MQTVRKKRSEVNLIRNAVDAAADGVRIVIRARAAGSVVVIQVEDNGPGVPREHIPHLFDPFFTTRRETGGTGLGLSIVHGIIAGHGGTIDVTSQLGQGTVFTIELPGPERTRAEVGDG